MPIKAINKDFILIPQKSSKVNCCYKNDLIERMNSGIYTSRA